MKIPHKIPLALTVIILLFVSAGYIAASTKPKFEKADKPQL